MPYDWQGNEIESKAKETIELNFKELQAKYEESVKELEELKNGYKK